VRTSAGLENDFVEIGRKKKEKLTEERKNNMKVKIQGVRRADKVKNPPATIGDVSLLLHLDQLETLRRRETALIRPPIKRNEPGA